jgi:hypothetical protein
MFYETKIESKKYQYFITIRKNFLCYRLSCFIFKNGYVFIYLFVGKLRLFRVKFKVHNIKFYDYPLFQIKKFMYKLMINLNVYKNRLTLLVRWNPA